MSQNRLQSNIQMLFDEKNLVVPLNKEVIVTYQKLFEAIKVSDSYRFYERFIVFNTELTSPVELVLY